jgi:hypothetical protein
MGKDKENCQKVFFEIGSGKEKAIGCISNQWLF